MIADAIKATTPEAVAKLKAAGVTVIMLTGDDLGTARAVGAALHVDDVFADVLPHDKARIVKELHGKLAAWRQEIKAPMPTPNKPEKKGAKGP